MFLLLKVFYVSCKCGTLVREDKDIFLLSYIRGDARSINAVIYLTITYHIAYNTFVF